MPNAVINGFDMFYVDAGNPEGEPVICPTGWGAMSNKIPDALPTGLADRYRVLAYDHRGIGKSNGGLDRKGSTRLYAGDVVALLDHLGINRAHIVGLGGMGGCIAQWIGIDHPLRSHTLVLGHGWMRPDPFLMKQFETLRELRKLDFYKYQACAAVLCYRVDYFNAHVNEILGPKGGWSDLIEHQEAHLNFINACIEHDTSELLGRITAPSLVVQGSEFDLMTGGRLGTEIHERIPGSELIVLDEAPHATKSVPEAYARYSQAVLDFLNRHPLPAQFAGAAALASGGVS